MKPFLVAVVVGLLALPAFARQWTSRSGGFSLEAELVDVKEGNVILKKADGSQVAVPLNRLSLGDVRYVNEALRAAEEAVTGGAAKTPAGEKAQDAPPAEAADKQATADAAELRYRWTKGQNYVYRVRIVSERGYQSEQLSGNVTYKVKAATDDEIELSMTSDLNRSEKAVRRRSVIIPGHGVLFYSNVPNAKEVVIAVDPLGQVARIEGSSRLPYLLGDLAQMAIEPMPAQKQKTWTIATDPGVAVIEAHYPFYRYSPIGFHEGVPATEKSVYTIQGRQGKQILIDKRYDLTTATAINGKPRFEVAGSGKLAFNTERGVLGSLDYSLRVTVRDANKTEEIPLHVTCRLLSEADIAQAAKEADEAKQAAEREKQEKERPLTEAEIRAALADLASDQPERVSRATKLLFEKRPQEPNAKVARALETVMLKSDNAGNRSDAARALRYWSTAESVPALLKALQDQWAPARAEAIEVLCIYKSKEAIKPVAQLLSDHFARRPAGKFLRAVGPEAEDAVLVHLENKEAWTCAEACAVLESIGTSKSIPALEKAVLDENWMINGQARKALAAVKVREASGADGAGKKQ